MRALDWRSGSTTELPWCVSSPNSPALLNWPLIERVTELADPHRRAAAADALAQFLGGEHVLILIPDPELGIHLPAPGFPQTLPRGTMWRAFTKACLSTEYCQGALFFPTAEQKMTALGIAADDCSVLILLGGTPNGNPAAVAVAGCLVPQEMTAHIAVSQAQLARDAARQSRAQSGALETVRQDLEQAIHDRDLALHAGQMGTWRWDAETNRAVWSAMQEALFGLAAGAYDGTEEMFLRLVHPEDRGRVREAIERELSEGRGYREQYGVQWNEGGARWLSAQGNVLTDGQGRITGLAGVTWDVTEQKQAEQALIQQAEELARSNADLQQFAYLTSHDLQDPLRTIISYAQLIARRYQGRLDPDADEFLGYIVASGRRMTEMIDDLLSYSRVAYGEVSFVSVSRSWQEIVDESSTRERCSKSFRPQVMRRRSRGRR